MRFLIHAFGTEGDIRPFVALARGLHEAGHRAAICTPEGFSDLVAGHGVEHVPMGDAPLEALRSTMTPDAGPADSYRAMRRMTASMRPMMLDEWRAARWWRPDAIIHHPKSLGASHVAERLDIPTFIALPMPFFTPTGAFPIPFIGQWPLGERANRASYRFNHAPMLMYGSMINAFRTRTLGLSRKRRTDDLLHRPDGTPVPALYPISPHLVPPPADYPDHAHITGPWMLEEDAGREPPEGLRAFLDAGEPPVYAGFGSMGFGAGAEQRTDHIIETLTRHGRRVVLATGWGGLVRREHTDQVHTVTSVPHEWLFPRVEAVIHHGGSGTVHGGLRAGRPTLVCPFVGDQPFWGRRVREAGVGPTPVPRRAIAGSRLDAAVDELLNDAGIRDRAEAMGRSMAAEDGVAAAVRVLTS